MPTDMTRDPMHRKPLGLWPAVAIVVLQWLLWVGAPLAIPGGAIYGLLGGIALGVAIVVWWLFFSRAPWLERVGAIVLMVVALLATSQVVHASVSNGMMGAMLPIFSIPLLCLALVGWAVASRGLTGARRWAALAGAIALACSAMTLIRTGGVSGEGLSDLHWRWTASPEDRLLAQGSDEVPASAPAAAEAAKEPALSTPAPIPVSAEIAANKPTTEGEPKATGAPTTTPPKIAAEWPGFRGPERDSIVRGVRIETDWTRTPPVEIWRKPIGPAWSSFA